MESSPGKASLVSNIVFLLIDTSLLRADSKANSSVVVSTVDA